MPLIELNGERLAYTRAGSGPPLLLIHSLGTASWLWAGDLARWADFDVVAVDARGHGGSSCRGGFSVRAVAEDCVALLDALELPTAACVAISMGGPIAAHLLDIAPGRLSRLVISGSFAAQGEAGATRAAAVADTIRAIGMAEYGARYAADTLVEDIDPAVRDRLAASIAAMNPETYIEAARSVFTSDVAELMAAIAIPTLVVVGTRDGRTPPPLSQRIAALIPGAAYAEMDGARHLANLDRPDAFHAVVDPFLREAGDAATAG